MKNGWYKLVDRDNKWTDFWPENDQIVFVENDVITEVQDEYGKKIHNIKTVITEEMKKNMEILEF